MRLTKIRLEKFRDLFDTALSHLLSAGSYDVHRFEQTLKDAMKCGYQELKPFVIELAAINKYEPVAVYYMEHAGSAIGPVVEFWDTLGKVYGVDFYGTEIDERDAAKEAYWNRILKRKA